MPPLETYGKEFAKQTTEVRNILVPISVVASKQKKKLCHDFLDVCSQNTTKEKAKIYIQQYSELLKLKGGSKMLINIEKEMFLKLYSDAESVKKMQAIIEIYENRREIFASIMKDSLYQKGFESGDGDKNCTAKNIAEKISVVFFDYKNEELGFGFWYKEGTSKKIQKILEKLLEGYKNRLLSIDVENKYNWFIGRRFNFEIDKPINEILDTLHGMYRELEKMAIDELK